MPTAREYVEQGSRTRASLLARNVSLSLEELEVAESNFRRALQRVEELNAAAKRSSRNWSKGSSRDEAALLKQQRSEAENALREAKEALAGQHDWFPNFLDPRVPIGDETHNKVLRQVGEPRKFDFMPLPHDVLGERNGLIDIPRGVKIAKPRFAIVKEDFIRVRMALQQLLMRRLRSQGFCLVSPPLLAKTETLFASGYRPWGREDNFNTSDDLSLIGTSEQPIIGMHLGETLPKLPLLYAGDSLCFRTEAGSAGRDASGILRVHQFYKLEQMVFCHPDESESYHLLCQGNEEWLLQQLEIPYQTVLISSGDLGAPALMKYDCEGWFPSQGKYRELTSNSNIGNFQTVRGNIRFKSPEGKIFPHTISATGFSDRLILAIMENYQCKDGSIEIPQALREFFPGQVLFSGFSNCDSKAQFKVQARSWTWNQSTGLGI